MNFLDINGLKLVIQKIKEFLDEKVDKVQGKQLSTNDYTNEDKDKLASMKATQIVNDLTTGGENKALSAEQGKVLKEEVDKTLKGTKKALELPKSNCDEIDVEWVWGDGLNYPGPGFWYVNTIQGYESENVSTGIYKIYKLQIAHDDTTNYDMYVRNFSYHGWSKWSKVAFMGDNINHNEVDIVNDLTTGGENKALSAEQGKVLKEEKLDIEHFYDLISGRKLVTHQLGELPVVHGRPIEINSNQFRYNQLTNVIIPNSVKIIGSQAFANNQLTNVIIPDNVNSIGVQAFTHNQLTNVIIPDSVKSIDIEAFKHNRLNTVVLPRYCNVDKDAFDSDVEIVRR